MRWEEDHQTQSQESHQSDPGNWIPCIHQPRHTRQESRQKEDRQQVDQEQEASANIDRETIPGSNLPSLPPVAP